MPVELDAKTRQIFEEIKTLSFLQTAHLVKAFEDELGISAAAPVAVAAAPGAAPAAAEEEQTEFTVILKDVGPNKINVLKEVRAVTGLGLKEAKDLVDGAPKFPVKEAIKKEEAQQIKEKLEAVGAVIEIK
jgi:large subunit ribosomal protein L7/L12